LDIKALDYDKCRYKRGNIVIVCFIGTLTNCNDFEDISDMIKCTAVSTVASKLSKHITYI
ncbi:MAG: hypothetical protein RR998_10300, partial [Oscillospiraceae bacterium]